MVESADIRGLFQEAVAAGESGDLARAERLLRESLAVAPEEPRIRAALGDVLIAREDHGAALESYREAVRLAPEFAEAWVKLGIARGEKGDVPGAIDALGRGLELQPRNLLALYAMAQAHLERDDHEQAIACYRKALDIDPAAVEVHDALNEVLWEHDLRDEYLVSFPRAIAAAPDSLPIRLRFAGSLSHVGRHREAEDVLREAQGLFAPDAGIHVELGAALDGQGRVAEAVESFTRAVELAPGDLRCRQDLARVLITTGDYGRALEHVDAALALAPLDQRNLAFQGLVWRLAGDPRAEIINDYERFVKRYAIPVPAGYKDIDAFNGSLAKALDALHQTQVQHPLNQTLRGGTQTHGNLFERKVKEVQEARAGIEQCIRRYIDEMADEPAHPFLGRKSDRFRFSGSWSCRLGQEGFHTNHIHMEGWISSSYYVTLPDVVAKNDEHAGWIKFGETNLNLGEREHVGKIVEPKAGHLVLFPSYMFHGTVPFASNEVRTTVAFDVMPL